MSKKSYLNLLALFILSCAMLMTACSSEGGDNTPNNGDQGDEQLSANEDKRDNKEPETEQAENALADAPKAPETIEEVFNYPQGPLAGKKFKEEKELFLKTFKEELPKLENEASEEELEAYWGKTLALVHEDYPGPDDVIDDIKLESFGNPDIEDERYQFKDQFNVEIVLDASGSMAGLIGGKSKMDIAKDAIRDFTSSLPEGTHVGLRIYGHKGSNADSDKKISCENSELVYDIQPFDNDKLNKALDQFQPTGWTPIDLSLKEAQKDLANFPGEENTNVIYLVSDGVNTCGGDPVQTAKEMLDSNVQPILNVIGFDVDAKGQQELKEIAKAADGVYSNAANQEELTNEFDKAEQMAEKWEEWAKKASSDAYQHYFRQKHTNIARFRNTWTDKYNNEYYNLMYLLDELRDQAYITSEAHRYLHDKREKRWSMLGDFANKLQEDLNKLNEKDYNELKKGIEEAFEKNVQ